MRRADLGQLSCSLAAALAEVGDAWTLMIVKELMLGERRFEAFQAQTAMSSNSLAARLRAMEAKGLVWRRPYQQRPLRYEYRLTDKGAALWPVLATLTRWGDEHLTPDTPPMVFEHRACGCDAQPALRCAACGEGLEGMAIQPRLSDQMAAERAQRRLHTRPTPRERIA